jgi:hypothetical protein
MTKLLFMTGVATENQSIRLLDVSSQHVVLGAEGLVIGLSLTLGTVKVIYKIPYDRQYQICSDVLITLTVEQSRFCILYNFLLHRLTSVGKSTSKCIGINVD